MNRAKVLETGISKRAIPLKSNIYTGRFLRFVFGKNNREELFEVAVDVLKAWEKYENKDLEILRESNGEPHNAII